MCSSCRYVASTAGAKWRLVHGDGVHPGVVAEPRDVKFEAQQMHISIERITLPLTTAGYRKNAPRGVAAYGSVHVFDRL